MKTKVVQHDCPKFTGYFIASSQYFKVNDVVDVMRNNIDKVMERDAKLSDLDNR